MLLVILFLLYYYEFYMYNFWYLFVSFKKEVIIIMYEYKFSMESI